VEQTYTNEFVKFNKDIKKTWKPSKLSLKQKIFRDSEINELNLITINNPVHSFIQGFI